MSDRMIPFEETQECDNCGVIGAYDFVGDYLCYVCFKKLDDTHIENLIGNLIDKVIYGK